MGPVRSKKHSVCGVCVRVCARAGTCVCERTQSVERQNWRYIAFPFLPHIPFSLGSWTYRSCLGDAGWQPPGKRGWQIENVNYCRRYADLSEGPLHRERARMKAETKKEKQGKRRWKEGQGVVVDSCSKDGEKGWRWELTAEDSKRLQRTVAGKEKGERKGQELTNVGDERLNWVQAADSTRLSTSIITPISVYEVWHCKVHYSTLPPTPASNA